MDLAKRRQVVIEDRRSQAKQSEEQLFLQTQHRLELIKQMKDLSAMINFLKENSLESSALVYYDTMTVKELIEQVYDEVLSLRDQGKGASFELKEKIGTLTQTNTVNPATFFSLKFKAGVYIPILSPFMVPLILTLQGYLKVLMCKKKQVEEEEKEKED